jgi:hypothetical protein
MGRRSVFVVTLCTSLASNTLTLAQAEWSAKDVTARPSTSVTATPLPTTISDIGASAGISYSALSAALTSLLPGSFDTTGRQKVCADLNEAVQQTVHKRIGGDVGRFLGNVVRIVTQVVTVNQLRNVCQDVDYSVHIDRTSPVTISPGTNKIHISTNVAINGEAGFSGDLAKALKLDKKNFRGGVEMFADPTFDVDEHWCPKVSGGAGFRWTDKAQLEIIHNVWLEIDGQVGSQIKDKLNDALTKLQGQIHCEDVTGAVQKNWRPYSLSVVVKELGNAPVFINFTPQTAGFSGVSYDKNDLRLAVTVGALTEVTTRPLPSASQAGSLPPLNRIPASSDTIKLLAPVRIGYHELSDAAKNYLRNRTFEADTPAGHVKVTVNDVEAYASDGQLAVGLDFAATTGRQLLDTKGKAYFLATPMLDPTTQTLKFSNIQYTAVADNVIWSTFSVLFQGLIKKEIEEKASIQLGPEINDLRAKLNDSLAAAAAKENIGLSLTQNYVGLKSVQLEDTTVDVLVEFDGAADLVVNQIPFGIKGPK